MGKKAKGKPIQKSVPKPPGKAGRPSKYSDALALKICTLLSSGSSLRAICRDSKMPDITTVLDWLNKPEHSDFVKMYENARAIQADLFFEDIIEIADNADFDVVETEYVNKKGETKKMKQASIVPVHRARLRIDARKWSVSRMAPKKYGDKVDITSGGKAIKEPRTVAINYVVPNAKKTA